VFLVTLAGCTSSGPPALPLVPPSGPMAYNQRSWQGGGAAADFNADPHGQGQNDPRSPGAGPPPQRLAVGQTPQGATPPALAQQNLVQQGMGQPGGVVPAIHNAALPPRQQPGPIDPEVVAATLAIAQSQPQPQAPTPVVQPQPQPQPPAPAAPVVQAPPASHPAEPGDVARPPLAAAPALRLVNSKRFTLGFEQHDLVAGGPLELWSTPDGRSWQRHENAQLQPGACVVEVKDEGTYGFSLVSHGSGAPRPGDLPQAWVTVDLTKPTVQLQGVEQKLTSHALNLVVRWTARDRNFGPRPINLAYAESADGPWMSLASNLPNTGRYEWLVPASVPRSVFVRVEAMDLAGNANSAQTPQVVRLNEPAHEPARAVLPPPPPAAPPETPRSPVSINTVEPATP
jgi:hypothetical protein